MHLLVEHRSVLARQYSFAADRRGSAPRRPRPPAGTRWRTWRVIASMLRSPSASCCGPPFRLPVLFQSGKPEEEATSRGESRASFLICQKSEKEFEPKKRSKTGQGARVSNALGGCETKSGG